MGALRRVCRCIRACGPYPAGVRRVLLALMAVLVLTAGVCDDDDPALDAGDGTTSSTTSTSAGGGSSTSSTTGACPANTDKQTAPAKSPRAQMVSLETGYESGFDSVVFEFTGTAPGYRVEYQDEPLTEDGSGDPVEVKGDYAIAVVMEHASAYDIEAGKPTYTGSKRVAPKNTRQVQEVVQTGDFEGYLSWGIGVKDRAGFRVRTLESPHRLVVQVCAS